MNELIKVDYSDERMKVSARELHDFLDVGTAYKDWFKRACVITVNKESVPIFFEGKDYTTLPAQKRATNNPKNPWTMVVDHMITVDMCKHICMMTRNEKGNIAREYFIQVEKDWNSPDKVMARALRIADQTINQLHQTIAIMEPKATFADQIADCTNAIYISDLAKLLTQNGFKIGRDQLFELLRKEGFLLKASGQWNKPSQYAMKLGLFKVIERVVEKNGYKNIQSTTMVTPHGVKYFLRRYLIDNLAGQPIQETIQEAIQ